MRCHSSLLFPPATSVLLIHPCKTRDVPTSSVSVIQRDFVQSIERQGRHNDTLAAQSPWLQLHSHKLSSLISRRSREHNNHRHTFNPFHRNLISQLNSPTDLNFRGFSTYTDDSSRAYVCSGVQTFSTSSTYAGCCTPGELRCNFGTACAGGFVAQRWDDLTYTCNSTRPACYTATIYESWS